MTVHERTKAEASTQRVIGYTCMFATCIHDSHLLAVMIVSICQQNIGLDKIVQPLLYLSLYTSMFRMNASTSHASAVTNQNQ